LFKLILAALAAMLLWSLFLLTTALYGWWSTPIAPSGDTEAFARAAIERLQERNRGSAAFVLLDEGAVVSEYYASFRDRKRIDRDTLFPAASMSKWITAVAVMNLVEQRHIDLDVPVSTYLSRWSLPPSEFDNDKVTVRTLLSHTSGLDDGLGFGDYRAGEMVPSLEDSLANPRASSGLPVAIALGRNPGEAFQYSGGGYLILELLVEEVTGADFASHLQDSLFRPLGMARATYEYLGELNNTSGSYDRDGEVASEYRYAARSATGLAVSAADLTAFVRAQMVGGSGAGAISENTVTAMRQPQASTLGADIWGLGTILYAPRADDVLFGHDGGNDPAINSTARINPRNRDGIIVMVTGHPTLATSLGSEWVLWQTGYPDFLSIEKTVAAVIPAMAAGCGLILIVAVGLGWRRSRQRQQA